MIDQGGLHRALNYQKSHTYISRDIKEDSPDCKDGNSASRFSQRELLTVKRISETAK